MKHCEAARNNVHTDGPHAAFYCLYALYAPLNLNSRRERRRPALGEVHIIKLRVLKRTKFRMRTLSYFVLLRAGTTPICNGRMKALSQDFCAFLVVVPTAHVV